MRPPSRCWSMPPPGSSATTPMSSARRSSIPSRWVFTPRPRSSATPRDHGVEVRAVDVNSFGLGLHARGGLGLRLQSAAAADETKVPSNGSLGKNPRLSSPRKWGPSNHRPAANEPRHRLLDARLRGHDSHGWNEADTSAAWDQDNSGQTLGPSSPIGRGLVALASEARLGADKGEGLGPIRRGPIPHPSSLGISAASRPARPRPKALSHRSRIYPTSAT